VAAPVQGRADFNPERRRRIRTRICICVRGHHRWPKISGWRCRMMTRWCQMRKAVRERGRIRWLGWINGHVRWIRRLNTKIITFEIRYAANWHTYDGDLVCEAAQVDSLALFFLSEWLMVWHMLCSDFTKRSIKRVLPSSSVKCKSRLPCIGNLNLSLNLGISLGILHYRNIYCLLTPRFKMYMYVDKLLTTRPVFTRLVFPQ